MTRKTKHVAKQGSHKVGGIYSRLAAGLKLMKWLPFIRWLLRSVCDMEES